MSALPPLLYKYRTPFPHVLDALRANRVWFSNGAQLNDPFDCFVRLPKAITRGEGRRILDVLRGRTYRPSRAAKPELVRLIENAFDAFERIGLLAEYASDHELLALLADPAAVRHSSMELVLMCHWAAGRFFGDTAVFCLAADPFNHVMWGNYANSYKGFAIGYRPIVTHPEVSRLRPVQYAGDSDAIDLAVAVCDPISTRDTLAYIKPAQWSYEQEWRIVVTAESGLRDDAPLEMAEIIFGSHMQPADRDNVRNALAGRAVHFRELRTAYTRGFGLSAADC